MAAAPPPVTHDTVIARSRSLSNQIAKLLRDVIAYNPMTVTLQELTLDYAKAGRYEAQLDEIRRDLYLFVHVDADVDRAEVELMKLDDGIKKILVEVSKLQVPLRKPIPVNTPNPVKLKPIEIPSFSGNFEEWPAFHDLFKSMVHDRTDIGGGQKLAYLQSALKGEAAALVSSYEHTDANFQEAWDQLKTRYDVKREIVFGHIETFIDFKPRHSDPDCGLRSIVDAINKLIRCVRVQAVSVDDWDPILIVHGLRKLDPESRQRWSMHFTGDLPTVAEFTEFLELRARSLVTSSSSSKASKPKPGSGKPAAASHAARANDSLPPSKCVLCSKDHSITQCSDFAKQSVGDKINLVKQSSICFNCLGSGHRVEQCPSKRSCKKCDKRHHTLLHRDSNSAASAHAQSPPSTSHCASSRPSEQVVLLGTLLVNVKDSTGHPQQCRVFVDNGSEAHFISAHCVSRLGLKPKKIRVPFTSVGHNRGPVSRGLLSFTMESNTQPFNLDITAYVLPKVAGLIPSSSCQETWSHLEDIDLSDPYFYRPHLTDILLGAEFAGHILLPEVVAHPEIRSAPVALNTRFGWMLNGRAPSVRAGNAPLSVNHAAFNNSEPRDMVDMLFKFWEQEEPAPQHRQQSSSDVECESHFISTHSVNPDGTYTVKLPFRPDAPELGKSRHAAVKSLMNLEKRLSIKPEIKMDYVKSIRDYISLGYIQPVPPEDLRKPPSASYYMPHHEVVKESSSSTKVRTVWNASAKTTNGVSLNQTLYTGPKLQVDLCPLLLRFMSYPVAISADIWKFYPQTSVHKDQQDFQRLVWREESNQPIADYRMTRVTFGVSAAPFLAIRAFHELANRVKLTHPRASEVIKEEFLVDNLLSGGYTLEAAIALKNELLEVMKLGGLKLLKFVSNSEALLNTIPTELRDPSTFVSIDDGDFVKTIGILWNPQLDIFSVKINVPDPPLEITKRTVLSAIARTYDPLGWLSPVTIVPKILIQEMWKAKLTWDEPLPAQLHELWKNYCEELPLLQGFTLPRNAFAPPDPTSTELTHQLHGFSDGSDKAHAACVYIRTEDGQGRASVKLLTAKTRVNPIYRPTTPRSELCGALLLTNLISTVTAAQKIKFLSVHCWTDSTVVLGRLSPEKKLPVFELNRIRKIMAVLPPHHWKHVRGDENPADAPSRGIPPRQLLEHPLWLTGPPWLKNFQSDPEPLAVSVANAVPQPVTAFINSCSSFGQMRRRVAYLVRYSHNLRAKKEDRRTGRLNTHELQLGLNAILKLVQEEAFEVEIQRCKLARPIKSQVKFLTPFLDEDGILRVGGRLEHAPVPLSRKHPALLPRNHHVARVIAIYYHLTHLHAGPNLLLSIIREQFWPIGGLHLTKHVVRSCVKCHRYNAVTATQLMGQLPPARVTPAPPFEKTGVDYAGPFIMALRTGRKPPLIEAYVALFVCMATKATHLELVSDLSTAAFIACLNRFISRRGLPTDIYSDEGTNFVGAKAELKELLNFVNSAAHTDGVKDFLAAKGISFHTNPPSSPHHGGLWEAAVKSMKFHLRRVMGTRNLTVEEFTTLLCQVEAMLNSRPLTPLSEDPSDMTALTPGHFLIGRPLAALPYPDLGHLPTSHLDRWQMVQCVSQHIWGSWKKAYLSLLQSRPKWYQPLPDLKPGTMVLLMDKDSSLGPQQWKLGRIVNIYPGLDGRTRVCDVRTNVTPKNPKGTILHRPVVKLSPLPIY